ncbi:MAG: VIT1/CCC1 transporter family protein [Gammaproteobacteria bacterium]|nr:VIT1/CCC1 transporter family protein [Gammaproteobacteria bacterium]
MSARENWMEEMQSAYLYQVLVATEPDPVKNKLFLRLGQAAEAQAQIWAQQARTRGVALPATFYPSWRARLVAALIRALGPRRLRPVLAAIKVRGLSVYSAPADSSGHAMPTSVEDFGHRHHTTESGGNLRAAVFGVSDGLVSNTSLIMGMAGAMQDLKVLLLTGTAGLLAGALSMAAGEYVSMRSQREMYEYQIGLERAELEEYPEEEAEELALIYEARGVPLEQARSTAHSLLQNPEHALDALAREELGLNPDALGSPWGAAGASFLAFTLGALVPLLPLVFAGANAIYTSAGAAVVSLFLIGAVLSLFTGKQAVWGGLRLTLIGGGAGVIAYMIGTLLGTGLG